MTDERLTHYATTWEPGSWHRTIAEQELLSRQRRPVPAASWIALILCTATMLITLAMI
jgi:hypothetical protein